MTDRDLGNIKLPRAAFEYHRDRKEQAGVSWERYMNATAPQVTEVREAAYAGAKAGVENATRGGLS